MPPLLHWAKYLENLYTGDAPSGLLPLVFLQMAAADPPIDNIPCSLAEVKESVKKLKGGKAVWVCDISTGMLKVEGEAMVHRFHEVLSAVWQSGALTGQVGWLSILENGKYSDSSATVIVVLHCSKCREKCSSI